MPSRHSGSSRSSFSSSRSSFSSSRSSFSRPSSHSSSSHSSLSSGWFTSNRDYSSRNNRTRYNNFNIVYRPRYNQPWGYYSFFNWYRPRPTIYYCVNHNYTYYPESWTSNGTEYKSGYYDENGKYYKEKPFIEKKVGKIYTKCPNCDYVKDYDYMDFYELENCPTCGTRMNIINDDDDIFIKEEYYEEESLISKIFKWIGYFFLGVAVIMLLLLPLKLFKSLSQNTSTPTIVYNNNNSLIGKTVYLQRDGYNSYKLVNSNYADNEIDKILTRDSDDNYYDAETGLYLYYSKDYNVWQYWYEPISGNFGDYGWMEHDQEGWWIEADYNNWIKVPSNFDTSNLWYVK